MFGRFTPYYIKTYLGYRIKATFVRAAFYDLGYLLDEYQGTK